MTGQDDKRANNTIVHTPLDIFTQSYEIGDLYDARDRTFLHMGRLFDTKAEEVREEVSKYEYLVDSNISTRIDKLGVSANMKADFLCGAVTVDGSASYASDDKEHVTRHTMHVILEGKTGTKKVDRLVYDLQETDLLLRGASCATHVITEVRIDSLVRLHFLPVIITMRTTRTNCFRRQFSRGHAAHYRWGEHSTGLREVGSAPLRTLNHPGLI